MYLQVETEVKETNKHVNNFYKFNKENHIVLYNVQENEEKSLDG